jgi:hypothetical protein
MNPIAPCTGGVTTAAKQGTKTRFRALALLCLATGIAGTVSVAALLLAGPHGEAGGASVPSLASPWGPPERFAANLPVGSPAPDFELARLRDGRPVRLSSFRGREPVVLIFGSLSCDCFGAQSDALEHLYQGSRGRAEFLLVYIAEAHVRIPGEPQPARAERVWRELSSRRLTLPVVLDDPEGRAAAEYNAWPRRLVVVGADGRVALDAGHGLNGQRGWDLAAVESWLKGQTH